MAGNSVGKIELFVATAVAAVSEHLAESPGEALVADVALEVDTVADRAALQHDGDRRHHGGDEVIIRQPWKGLDGSRRRRRRRRRRQRRQRRCGGGQPGVEAGGGGAVVVERRPSSGIEGVVVLMVEVKGIHSGRRKKKKKKKRFCFWMREVKMIRWFW